MGRSSVVVERFEMTYCRLFAFPLSDGLTMIHRHATRLSGPDKIIVGVMFLSHQGIVLLACGDFFRTRLLFWCLSL